MAFLYDVKYKLLSHQDYGNTTDFLKNAVNYGNTDGLCNDLWRVDDVSCVWRISNHWTDQ